MSDIKRLSDRNKEIAAMMQDGARLKDFYRFAAQNPHIELHDACQIVITRPKASVCFSFEEWNAMGRRVTRGRKGIAYYDREGNKHFVFDANDTHGDRRYNRLVLPMKRLLVGLDVLNGTEIYESSGRDYDKILSSVANYLFQNEGYTEDEERNRLLAEGITYSLYSKTGFPKEIGIELKGLPYSLRENARLFKEITDTANALREEVEQAYFRKINEVVFIDDTEENAVSDEPVIVKAEQEQVNEQPQNPVTPYYQRYLAVQEKYPNAVALMRLGDFYEVMGENAVAVASELDLTLTGRNVGLAERVPMCGFPYHVTEQYIEKILERHSVVVIEDGNEPRYILSHAAAHEQSESADEQSAAASDEYEPDFTEEYSDEEQADEYEDYYDELADAEDDEEQAESQPQEKQQKVKGIRERRRKEKPQPTLFDVMEGKTGFEQTPEERVTEWGLQRGSMTEHGKFRIYDKYLTNPTVKEFAAFLRHEYGTGGSYAYGREFDSDGKGLSMAWRDKENPENDVIVKLNWTQAANGIADLIDDGNYFTEQEKVEYAEICRKRAERTSAATDAERLKVIARQFIAEETKRTWNGKGELQPYRYEESAEFVRSHKDELTAVLLSEPEVKAIHPTVFPYADNVAVEFYPEYCPRVEKDEETLSALTRDLDKEEDEDWESAVAGGVMKPTAEQPDNTDLAEVGFDQGELGGAKARFRGNIMAIQLVNRLYDENRTPTSDERKVLAKYVGWGGLAEAFNESNEKWRTEYLELKTVLSTEEYERAKGSVLNAHFTSKEVIEGIYKALNRFGVKGNNKILEPAMGTGNFFGYMPREIADGAKLYGVELDGITGSLAKKLYPNAKIQVKGFEETSFANDSFDLVVGNVPFGGYSVYDTDYNKYNFRIHDYFLAKSMDKLKPNGVMAVITSKGTMDKLNPTARKYLADHAELLGAIRLPNTAFKQTANTEAVTDILFFRKREQRINADVSNSEWLSTGKTDEGYEINSYFIRHPEMILGTLAEEHGLYGGIDLTVKPDGRALTEALNDAISRLPQDFYTNPEPSYETEAEETEADYDVRPLNYKASAGRLYMRIGERMVEQSIPKSPKDAYQRIVGMITLRNSLRHILDIQADGCGDEQLQSEQRMLNANYDAFVRKYGYVNSQTNSRLFREDGDSALLFACEELSEDKKTATKADVFTKRTIRPYAVPTSTDDCFEAMQISKNERGRVDIAYVEELTKKDYDAVLSELGNVVFRNPDRVTEDKYSGFETSEEYLSGEVVKKLYAAQGMVNAGHTEYERNVAALEGVQPEPLTASEISVRIGTSWIDRKNYKDFLCCLLDIRYYYSDGVDVTYNPHDGSWKVDKTDYVRNSTRMRANEVYGTGRASAFRLFEDALNLRDTNIYDTVEENGKEKRVLNQAETIAAREKQNKIKEAFKDWIFADPDRREALERTYNAMFNKLRLPSYDGSYLKFPGMNPAITLKPHQKNAVHRIITGGNTLLHHVVGAGKTFTICAAIMKLRQYGLCKKAMIAVPNHLVEQWADEFRKLYPSANLLIASKEDLEKDKRERFVSKVAMGDWDAVIIAQSSFAKINISPERQIEKIREEIAGIERSIESQWEDGSFPRGAVKRLESIKKGKETQLKKLLDESKKDNLLLFERLGVDYLFVDEAHYYKNKFIYTKMNNVAGISTAASQRAADLELKVEYINELHGGDKGVVFATGTPISNSMTEMYTMQSYLQKRTLQELGLTYFDAWAADFGETVTSLEMAPSGQGYKPRTRFAKFTNLPELLTLYRSFSDVQTSDMVKLDVPEAERSIVNLKPSERVIELAEEIADRAESIHNGSVDPHVDNMLKVTSDGKKLALDVRCFDPVNGDEEGSKLNACAGRVYEIWERTKSFNGTQLVFCDLSTPKCAFDDYEYGRNFDVYNDLKYKLVQMGIPKEEIAYIHDANSDSQKQALFKNVNSGKVRVLIGSTEKCGAGTNAQERLCALHHLDTPYRPSDMQQREGRIIRQGNTNKRVQIFTYVTERTFDSYSYQILENKQRFISQIDRGDLTVREADDIDETTLSYAEIKAITAANPRIKRKMELDTEVARLRVLEGQYRKNLYSLQDKIRKDFPEKIRKQELYLERLREDVKRVSEQYNPDNFSISVNGKMYTDKKEGARALTDALYASKPDAVVAEYGGLKISMNPLVMLTEERQITLTGAGQYVMDIGSSAVGNMTRLDNFFTDFSGREAKVISKLEQLKADLIIAEQQVNVPFEHKARLEELGRELSEINAELDLNRREEVVIDEDYGESDTATEETQYMGVPETQVQRRARKQPRKPLDRYVLEAYDKQKAEAPDSYVFIKNGGNYELFGNQAKEFFERYGLKTVTDVVNGIETEVAVLDYGALDRAIAELVNDGKQVRIIEELSERKEEDFLDENDKIEQMTVEVLPDDTVSQEEMNEYGYLWNGMLPLRKETAERLYKQGLDICRLYGDDTQKPIDADSELYEHEGLFGIEKPDWILHTESKNEEAVPMAADVTERKSYMVLVRESVEKEYKAFYAEEMQKPKEDLINSAYKIHFFNELHSFLGEDIEDNLTDRDFQALYTDAPNILHNLYDYYLDSEYSSVNNYSEIAEMIAYYNDRHHAKIVKDRYVYTTDKAPQEPTTVYYGKDTENTAYYRLESLAFDSLTEIKEKADSYVIAAPVCYLSDEQKEKYHIFFLKIDRDILEEKLKNKDEAISNMQFAVDRINAPIEKQIPIYYQSAEYAYSHGEQGAYNNSAQASRECIKAIGEAIGDNYKDNTLGKGFEDKIIERFGKPRVDYVLATVIRNADWDKRYLDENRKWAESIPISESEDERKKIYTAAHPGLVDLFASRIRKYSDKVKSTPAEQDKFVNETKQGFKVLNLTKDSLDRDIAIIQRSNDFVVAAGYNVKDGSWAQGYYDFPTLDAAEKFREENYGLEKENKNKTEWLKVNVSKDALIRKYENHSFMRMPNGEYGDYTYNVFNKRVKDSTLLTDMQSDTRELSYEISIPNDGVILLKTRDGDEVELTAEEFKEAVNGTSAKDYERQSENGNKKWFSFALPREAMRGMYESSSLFIMPKGEYEGQSYYLPNAFLKEDEESEGESIAVNIPEDLKVTVRDKDADAKKELAAFQYYLQVKDKTAEDYAYKPTEKAAQAEVQDSQWYYTAVPEAARIAEYENRTLFKMPQGEYEGYVYYLPNGLLKENGEKNTIRLSLPSDMTISLADNKNNRSAELSPEQFIEELRNKTEEDYATAYSRPDGNGGNDKFAETEKRLREKVPQEMKERPNWVIVRTKADEETGKLKKYLIDCHTGKFAESDNPETWTDFESACKYARENGGVTLAYALDGKDKICCIDLDNCYDENNNMSPLMSSVTQKTSGSYCERSLSGKGQHFFGKTDGMNVRTFAKDGDMEFYQKAHFIAMTGDTTGGSELLSFDNLPVKDIILSKCEKRNEWKGMGKGVEGLSVMSDRDVVEKACGSKYGETFKALYDGQDLQNNHSNSDMSLMNRLAFWCNGDKEQMLRIFATSGLYRPNKSPDYYEGTAIKAIKDTGGRYQPQAQAAPKPAAGNNSGKGGK